MPKSGDCNEQVQNVMKTGSVLLYSAKTGKKNGSEIRELRAFKNSDCTFGAKIGLEIRKLRAFKIKDSDCTFGARVRKIAGARICCIPELLALKGLT